MGNAIGKAERLLELEMLLLSHPLGLRRADIAKALGINRSTAGRYVTDLTRVAPIAEADDGRLSLDQRRYLSPVRLTAKEIDSIRLAFRLFRRKIGMPFPQAAAALRKLALAAERASPALSRGLQESADSLDSRAFPVFTRRYRDVIEQLIDAAAESRIVIIRHHSRRRGEDDEYRFQPFSLEPYPDGNSIHAVGFCPDLAEMRTFKVERIQGVRVTDERFEKPSDFDIDAYTSGAWGIWGHGGRAPVGIMLRFSSTVAERVRETLWHDSQVLEEGADGTLLFHASVAEPLEMYPWIRGWGADVEILEPKSLRDRMREEVGRMRTLYGPDAPPGEHTDG